MYDEYCRLCLGFRRFIEYFDKSRKINWIGMNDNEFDENLSEKYGMNLDMSTMLVLQKHGETGERLKISEKSNAVFEAIKIVGFPINLLLVFKIVPTSIRDFCYMKIACNRYRIFGRCHNKNR